MENYLKMYLAREKKTQRELAAETGKSTQQVQNWVSGKSVPPLELAIKIAKSLNTTVEDIWKIT